MHVPRFISCVVQPLQFKYISIPGMIFIYFSIVFNGIVIFIWKSFFKSNHLLKTVTNYNIIGGGGCPTPFLPMEKCVFSHFSPWGKWEKKYMERKGKVFISLSFHILFPHFSHGKNGKTHIFPWAKMGLDPSIIRSYLKCTLS